MIAVTVLAVMVKHGETTHGIEHEMLCFNHLHLKSLIFEWFPGSPRPNKVAGLLDDPCKGFPTTNGQSVWSNWTSWGFNQTLPPSNAVKIHPA